MIKTNVTTDLNLISCQNCGTPILTFGDNMVVVIPSMNFKCGKCGSQGVFDMIYGDTSKGFKADDIISNIQGKL